MVTVVDLERIKSPICPLCGQPMQFARSIPGIGGLPELRTYDCKACKSVETEVCGRDSRANLADDRRRLKGEKPLERADAGDMLPLSDRSRR